MVPCPKTHSDRGAYQLLHYCTVFATSGSSENQEVSEVGSVALGVGLNVGTVGSTPGRAFPFWLWISTDDIDRLVSAELPA